MVALVLLALLETEDQPGRWEPPDRKDSPGTQGRPESRVPLECLVRGVLRGKMERWDPRDPQDLLAALETEESRDPQESPASRVYLETKVHLERRGNLETWVFPESWVLWDKSDRGEREGSRGREESWGRLGCRDPRASPERPVLTGLRAVLDPPEQLEMQVLLVYRECPERGASLDPPDPKETGEPSEKRDLRERLETTEPEAPRDLWDQLDPRGPAEKRVNRDLKDPWDLWDRGVSRGREETPGPSALLDSPGPLVLTVSRE